MNNLSKLFSRGYNTPIELDKVERKDVIIDLDSQQFAVVNSPSKNIIVVAGAGSGKTRVLTERIKKLVADGVPPHNIVAITFTNMAAEEMKDRLSDVPGIGDAFIGTIHSFANKIMKLSGEEYTLYTEDIDVKLHNELITKYGKHITLERYLKFKELLSDVEIGKASESDLNSFLSLSERSELHMFNRNPADIQDEIAFSGRTEYPECIKTLCQRDNIITFDDLLVKADAYFRETGSHIEHLLVDELQDVGSLEFRFIEGLNANSYFFVGDDFQSIYGFKGGNVKIFLMLVENSQFDVYYLTNNYRNSRSILDVAKLVIDQVSNKIEKSVTPIVEEEGSVSINTKKHLSDVLWDIKDEKSYRDWFILTRSNKELFHIVEKCREIGVPCVTFKREGMSVADLNKNLSCNKVKILTVHTAKGLESDNVVLYGNFPLVCPTYLNNEEERKVMYVGVTRARKRLIILN